MCFFIRPPASQVIQQRRDRTGKENEDRAQDRGQCPIEPGDGDHRGRLLFELAEHLRPEVAAEFGVFGGRDRLLEKLFHLFVIFFIAHFALTSTPKELSFLRSIRTARKTRTLTSAAEIPTASAMLLYGSSSIRASVATRRYFAGSSRNACLIRSRVSPRTAEFSLAAQGRSSGSSVSRRACRRWSRAALVAMRRAQARKLPAGSNRVRDR